jgi:uncharacterized MAPEG superfamily protein
MIIVARLAIPVFLVIDRVIVLKLRIEKAQAGAATTFMAFCVAVSFFTLNGLVTVTLNESAPFHITAAILFVI